MSTTYRNVHADDTIGIWHDTRKGADRLAERVAIPRVAVLVITTNGDELPDVEIIDTRKPKPPTTWLVVDRVGDHWQANSDAQARNLLDVWGGHAWRYDGDGTVTEVTL